MAIGRETIERPRRTSVITLQDRAVMLAGDARTAFRAAQTFELPDIQPIDEIVFAGPTEPGLWRRPTI
jgi:hypothetical protein